MPQITIPKGTQIIPNNEKTIEIKVQNTNLSIIGKQHSNKLWNIYLKDNLSQQTEILKQNISTKTFSLFSNIILKQPFPYSKKKPTIQNIKKFINKITKTKIK